MIVFVFDDGEQDACIFNRHFPFHVIQVGDLGHEGVKRVLNFLLNHELALLLVFRCFLDNSGLSMDSWLSRLH